MPVRFTIGGPGSISARHCGASLVLLGLLNFRWFAGVGAWAASVTHKPWLQGFCFAPVILLLLSLFHLPLAVLGHHISLSYGQSIQGWGSWFVDWGKAVMLDLVSGTVILSVLFALIRNSRRWWIWLWILSLPMQLLFVFVLPLVVDPMFNHFEPLAQTNPALVAATGTSGGQDRGFHSTVTHVPDEGQRKVHQLQRLRHRLWIFTAGGGLG